MSAVANGPTPYKISTITATGDVNVGLHLDVLFAHVPLIQRDDANAEWGFSAAQFVVHQNPENSENSKNSENSENGTDMLVRRSAIGTDGVAVPMQKSSRRKRRPTRHFDNQCTLIYWERERSDAGVERGVNLKCFRNGRVQMTGVKNIPEGSRIIDRLVETIREVETKHGGVIRQGELMPRNYRVCLINSDFQIGYFIKRDVLHSILCMKMGLVCSFEPCIYPGVKLSFMWNHSNTARNCKQDGRCTCTPHCKGTGSGYGPGDCRKVTCAIFQSGCTIITGARDYKQLDDAYKFVCEVTEKYRADIEKKAPPSTNRKSM